MSDRQPSESNGLSTTDPSKIDLLSEELDDLRSRIDKIEKNLSIEYSEQSVTQSAELTSNKKGGNTSVLNYFNKNEYCDLVITQLSEIRELVYSEKITASSPVRVLIPEEVVEELKSRFPLNAKLRSRMVEDNVDIRMVDTDLDIPLAAIITDSTVVCQFNFGSAQSLVEGDRHLHDQLRLEYDDIFANSEEVDLGIPPWEKVLQSLEEATTSETAAVFERFGQAVPPEKDDSVDSVKLAIFAAAQTEVLQYDISKWGEEMGIGSGATFSRRKSKLVENEVIITTKEPVDTGRPRDRLHWGPNAESYVKETFSEVFATSGLEPELEGESSNNDNTEVEDEDILSKIVEEFI